jgi:hypothetical protein
VGIFLNGIMELNNMKFLNANTTKANDMHQTDPELVPNDHPDRERHYTAG